MAFIDDWKIPSEKDLANALDEAVFDTLEFVKNEPETAIHTGTVNQRTGKNRSRAGELFANDSKTTMKSFEAVPSGELSVEIVNKNTEVVGYLVDKGRVIISDEAEKFADRILAEKVENLLK